MNIFNIIFNSEMYNQWVNGHIFGNSLWGGFGLIIIIASLILGIKTFKNYDEYSDDNAIIIIACVFACFVGSCIFVSSLGELLQFIFYPQGLFLDSVLHMFK